MPLELQIIRASEFIRVGAPGQIDLAMSCEILQKLAGACRLRGIERALLDLRDVHPGRAPMLSRDDLASLVGTFCSIGFSDRLRLVLLYSSDPHHRARMFALMSVLHGWNVKASENFEEAVHWLSLEQGPDERKHPSAQAVPVRGARTPANPVRRIPARADGRKEKKTPPNRSAMGGLPAASLKPASKGAAHPAPDPQPKH
jgi:hypothetical protein